MANKKLVERPQSAETELDRGTTQVMAAKRPQITTEIVPLKFLPVCPLLSFIMVPVTKLLQSLTVIALRVNRCPAIGRQVLEELC